MENIHIHEKIKIDLISPSGSISETFYAVIEEQNKKVISLTLLPSFKLPLEMKSGQRIKGTFLEEGSLYNFDSNVISINKGKTESGYIQEIIKIANPSYVHIEELGCYQRIGFTGIEGFVPFRYDIVKRGDVADISMRERGVAIWLGGDSLVMVNILPILEKSLIAIFLELPKHPSGIKLFGKVVQKKQREELYEMDVQFEGLREKDRDAILAYILARQAELRRGRIEEEAG